MRKYLIKFIGLFLIASILLVNQPTVQAQTASVYKAKLLVPKGKEIDAEAVEISLASDAIQINGAKKSTTAKSILLTEIESVEYTYSERPRYTAATLTTLAVGVIGLAFFFTKTKKNWLTVNAGENSAILQLQSSNYRMLLLALRGKGVKISDSGDRDEKEKDKKESKKTTEKSEKPATN